MHLHSRYRSKKFATGGAVILGHGEDAVMRPPPGEPPAIEVPSVDDAPPADQVAAAIAKARNPRSEMPLPEVRQPDLRGGVLLERRGIYSAPTNCRENMSWSGRREDRPGSITLTPAMKEAARISGLTEVEYSRNLLRLREAKAADPDRYGSGQ
jgi:hypothetical protein